jgi:hypothetical protein
LENRDVNEIMWNNRVDPDKPQTTTWRMRVVCWIPKAANTHTHSEQVILIVFLCGEENQLDDTQRIIVLVICSTFFGHLYAYRQELETILRL